MSSYSSKPAVDSWRHMRSILILIALAVPWLLTFNWAPSATFLNQAAAWAAWAGFLILCCGTDRAVSHRDVLRAGWPVLTILGVMAIAALLAPLRTGLPASLSASTLATCAGGALLLVAGSTLVLQGRITVALQALFIPLLIASSLTVIIVVVQIFFSELAGNAFIAASAFPQRASGNLRQPNHVSTLASCALVAVVWLHQRSSLHRVAAVVLATGLVGSMVLTGSRTGLVGIFIIAAWGVADRRLSGFNRWLLCGLPVIYALGWWLFKLWAARAFGDADSVDRIASGGDISSARFAIWANTLELIGRHPWFGVGFGEFNLAWSLTPFADRPTQFYDHSHNLLLQWAVELGLPLALLLTLACMLAMWRCLRAPARADAADAPGLRSAFMLILLVMLHSMLEYPLWYSYFLLPTLFAFGICLGARSTRRSAASASPGRLPNGLRGASVLMLVLSAFAVADYRQVVVIFAPQSDALPLSTRIEAGKRSIFFAHHAHYAAATTAEDPEQAAESYRVASHFLLDTRFMLAWAKAQADLGNVDRARFLADRLREFRNPASSKFFEACDQKPAAALPFQCQPSDAALGYRDFLRR